MLPRLDHPSPPSPPPPAAARSASCGSRRSRRSRSSPRCSGRPLKPREATYLPFLAADGGTIDQGLAIHFPAPHSYTGEDVLELQAHGGPVVLQLLLARCLEAGAACRPARGRTRRIHAARLPQRQARPGPGRGHRRPDRRQHRSGGAQRHAVAVRRVLARDPRAARRADPPAHAGRGHAGLPGRGDRLPAEGRRARPAGAAAQTARAGDAARTPGRAAARRPARW